MSKINDERRKLYATLLNNMANACFAIGIVAPIAATLYKKDGEPYIRQEAFEVGVLFWIIAVGLLHLYAQWIIGGMDDE